MNRHIKLTRSQKEAAEVWIFDPMSERFPGTLSGSGLIVKHEDLEEARRVLCVAIESCTDSESFKDLSALAIRL